MDPISSGSSENNSNFDNDFEKLDACYAHQDNDNLVESSNDLEIDDRYKNPTETVSPVVTANLLDLGDNALGKVAPEPDSTADFKPSSSVQDLPKEPSPLPKSTPSIKLLENKCQWLANLDPKAAVLDLIYWRDVCRTSCVLSSLLFVLLSLALFSVLSVIAYLHLTVLIISISYYIYRKVIAAVQKTGEGHPYKCFLEMDMALSEERVQEVSVKVVKQLSSCVRLLRRLLLVEDLVDSIKFGLLLWVLTYIGAWFNGMTLLILGVVTVFTLPKVYETYQVEIDKYVGMATEQLIATFQQVKSKLPLPGKKKSE